MEPNTSSCCETSPSAVDCCDNSQQDDQSCHDDKEHDQNTNCQDNCTACHSCHHSVVTFVISSFKTNFVKKTVLPKSVFSYNFPYISNSTFNIWQPPKLV